MFPVINFLVKFETIIKLIHLDFLWIVPAKYFGKDPPVGEVSLGVLNFVSQVQRLHPHVQFTG
jgi:hypothetical protein